MRAADGWVTEARLLSTSRGLKDDHVTHDSTSVPAMFAEPAVPQQAAPAATPDMRFTPATPDTAPATLHDVPTMAQAETPSAVSQPDARRATTGAPITLIKFVSAASSSS